MSLSPDDFPGIDPRDREWLAEKLRSPSPPDGDGVCFANFGDEVLGPFACKADAEAAQNRKLHDLAASGVDLLSAEIRMSIVFTRVNPALYSKDMPDG